MSNGNGGPAFPSIDSDPFGRYPVQHKGLSLRDYFAAAALTGLLSNAQIAKDGVKLKLKPEHNQAWHAEAAYQFADAMLEERSK